MFYGTASSAFFLAFFYFFFQNHGFCSYKIVLKKDCSAKCTFLQRRYWDGIWGVSTEERESCEAKKYSTSEWVNDDIY